MPPAENSLLRLVLDARQQPCLDMDGTRIDTTQMSPAQRKRLIDLMVMMRPWIDAGPLQRQPTGPLPPAPAPVVAPPAPQVANPVPPAQPLSAPTTMVGQIDAILQGKLVGSMFAGQGIRLVESAQGGAMVVVGLNRYAGVGEVPDPEIQALIRSAIAEWEKKYTPG